MWLFSTTDATHVNVDQSTTTVRMRSVAAKRQQSVYMASGSINFRGTLRWVGSSDIDLLTSLPNPSDVKLQEPGDNARCVWLAVDDKLMCVGRTKIDRTRLDSRACTFREGPATIAVAGKRRRRGSQRQPGRSHRPRERETGQRTRTLPTSARRLKSTTRV